MERNPPMGKGEKKVLMFNCTEGPPLLRIINYAFHKVTRKDSECFHHQEMMDIRGTICAHPSSNITQCVRV
jgi:hypothetical protein